MNPFVMRKPSESEKRQEFLFTQVNLTSLFLAWCKQETFYFNNGVSDHMLAVI